MERTCQRCNQPVPQEAFLCPHCGAILESVTAEPVVTVRKPARKMNFRHIFSVILAVLLVGAVVLLIGSVLKLVRPGATTPTTQPTTTAPAPLVPYEVKVRSDQRGNLKGILVMLCKDGEVLYTCKAGDYGKATFVLPQKDGYTIRLAEMPQPYQILYGTTEFSFEPGKQELEIILETKNVPYTVRVVNREGEPLPDTRIYFYGAYNRGSAITDEDGCCVFMDRYLHSGYQAGIEAYPTGYYASQWLYDFEGGSVELTIVLDRYEDVKLPSGSSLYTVRVVDEFGQPIAGLRAALICDQISMASCYTNSDGVAVFKLRYDNGRVGVAFPTEVDYSHLFFEFAQGSRELEIVLQTQNTTGTYTYQVHFHDQFMQPIPGMVISHQLPDGSVQYYTSDENGDVFMELAEADPTKVSVRIEEVPEDYEAPQFPSTYTFDPYSRVMPIAVMYGKLTPVTIKVLDQNGNPVPGVVIAIRNGNNPEEETHVATGPSGTVNFEADPMTYYEVWIYVIPNGYSSDTPPQYINAESGEVIFVLQPS